VVALCQFIEFFDFLGGERLCRRHAIHSDDCIHIAIDGETGRTTKRAEIDSPERQQTEELRKRIEKEEEEKDEA
jgi:hypothetical protein